MQRADNSRFDCQNQKAAYAWESQAMERLSLYVFCRK